MVLSPCLAAPVDAAAGAGVLRDLVVIAAVALGVIAVLRRARVPTVAGLIVAGALAGPHALGFVALGSNVERIAEIGVALLLFGLGLDLHLEPLRRLWRHILLAGALQMAATIGVGWAIARGLGLPDAPAVFVGFLVAVSSTAIVLRGLQARGEVDAPHGRLTVGVLVFQDLCVVPLLVAVPLLAGGAGVAGGAGAAAWHVLRTLLLLAAVVVGARLVVPRLLHAVARWRQRDLFVLAVFLVCLGTAWVATQAGVSLALGAFCAGLVVSDSEYRHQALSDLIPFREVLASVFFVSVGMLLDAAVVGHAAPAVLGLLVLVVVGKFAIAAAVVALLRVPARVAVLTGLGLAQMGEFAFVLAQADAQAAEPGRLLQEPWRSALFAAGTLSMVVTPLLLAAGPALAAGMTRARALTHALDVTPVSAAAHPGAPLADHVIIAGHGVAGRALALALRAVGLRYVLVDLNPDTVRRSVAEQVPAYYGDVTSPEVLERLGVRHARALAVTINDPLAAERAVATARRLAPGLLIVARSRYVAERAPLRAAGATAVVAGELEGAVEVARQVLRGLAVDGARLDAELARIRADRDPDPHFPEPADPGGGTA